MVLHPRGPFPIATKKAKHQADGTDYARRLYKACRTFHKHEERMVAGNVVRAAILDGVFPGAIRCAGKAMMQDAKVGEAARRPAKHVGFEVVHRIPAGRAHDTSEVVPALSPVDLGGSANMKYRTFFECDLSVQVVVDAASGDAKSRVLRKFSKALLEIVRREAEVSVEFYDELPVVTRNPGESLVERIHLTACGVAVSAVVSMADGNPGILLCVAVHDLACAIAGAIVHENPLNRQNVLVWDRREGLLNVVCFIASRCDDDVLCHDLLPRARRM